MCVYRTLMSFSHTHIFILFTRETDTQSSSSGSSPSAYGNFQLDRVSLQCNMLRVCAPMQIIISNIKLSISNKYSFLSYVNNYFFVHRLIVSHIHIDRSCLFSKHDFLRFDHLKSKRGKKNVKVQE